MSSKPDSKPPIVKVLIYYGAEETSMPSPGMGWRPIKCPFHDDRSPSASINTTFEAFNCHTCDVSGDSWKIICEREGVKFAEAVRFAETHFGYENDPLSRPAKQRSPYRPSWL